MNTTPASTAADERRAAALALVAQGRVAEAERAFGELLRDQPDDADALNFLAICAHGRGQADAALELLGRAQAEHPADTTTLTNLGVLHRGSHRLTAPVACEDGCRLRLLAVERADRDYGTADLSLAVRGLTASASRPDVATAFPGYGPNHGFLSTFPISPGTHQVCIYAIDRGLGENRLITCRTVTA